MKLDTKYAITFKDVAIFRSILQQEFGVDLPSNMLESFFAEEDATIMFSDKGGSFTAVSTNGLVSRKIVSKITDTRAILFVYKNGIASATILKKGQYAHGHA